MMKSTATKKMVARVFAVLMILAMIVTSFAAFGSVFAATGSDIAVGDYVMAGKTDAEGYTGTPMWRVLDKKDDGSLLLMSEYTWTGDGTDAAAKVKFNGTNAEGNKWQGSLAQTWCQGFETAVLGEVEGLTINPTTQDDPAKTVTISSYTKYTFTSVANILNGDKVFFLSIPEIDKYMPEMAGRVAYAAAGATAGELWWTRSPESSNKMYAGGILKNGKYNKTSVASTYTARPAFWATASGNWTSEAQDGKTVWTFAGGSEEPAHEHAYGEPTYTWDGYDKCTAKAECACGDVVTEDATITSAVTKKETVEEEGVRTYTATFQNEMFASQTKEEPIAKHVHAYGEPAYTWDGYDKCTAKAECACGDVVTEDAVITSAVTKKETVEEEGVRTYTATFQNPIFASQTKDEAIAKHVHAFGEPTYTWAADHESCVASVECTLCGEVVTEEATGAAGTITCGTYKAATVDAEGITRCYASFENPLFQTSTMDLAIAKLPVKAGYQATVNGQKYKVVSAKSKTVAFVKGKNVKTVTVPATVKIAGKTYKVNKINAKAFAKTKTTKVIVKTTKLTKSGVKASLKGSKVKKISVKVGKKTANKKYAKKYAKYFTKKNAGRKVTVK